MKKMIIVKLAVLLIGVAPLFFSSNALASDSCKGGCAIAYKACEKRCDGDTDCLLGCSDTKDNCIQGCEDRGEE